MSSGYVSLNHHTCQEGARVCVHIGVGFGVACSDTKAIPEPRNAEQQQCSPAFFVCLKDKNNTIAACKKQTI